jgi:hypothetical protein
MPEFGRAVEVEVDDRLDTFTSESGYRSRKEGNLSGTEVAHTEDE